MTTHTLLPCPFCGSTPRLVDLGGWEILCDCGADLCLHVNPNKEDSISAWNRRAHLAAPAAEPPKQPCVNCVGDKTGKIAHAYGCPNDTARYATPPAIVPGDVTVLRDALETARNGLLWFQDNCPEDWHSSDYKAMEQIDAALDAALRGHLPAQPSAQAVPEGMVMVPREPTESWLDDVVVNAGVWPRDDKHFMPEAFRDAARKYHAAMITAAPAQAVPAPVVPEGDVVVSKDEQGQIVAVTRQDDEGHILSVIAESAAPVVREIRRVRKIGGSFQHTGNVVAEFKTVAGEDRIVIEFDAPVTGMLHVYRPDQLEECDVAKVD